MRPNRQEVFAGSFPIAAQREIGLEIVQSMGFETSGWRLDDAVHPFAASPSRGDIRVTSRFDDHSLTGLFALMHEVGHGLYENGIDPALERTTLGGGVSLGVHESQSRLWENLVGRSPQFWSHWLPRMRDRFPLTLRDVDLDTFIRAINVVRPTLIRVEADEVTYSLHVILRFELELALIDGSLDAADLPAAWAAKMKQFLGIEVPDDLRGVLQDIHWSEGIIGYFPTYAIGNVLAAQLWRVAHDEITDLDGDLERGELGALRVWLREKIHRHGRLLTPPELIDQAVGGPLDPAADARSPDAEVRRAVRVVAGCSAAGAVGCAPSRVVWVAASAVFSCGDFPCMWDRRVEKVRISHLVRHDLPIAPSFSNDRCELAFARTFVHGPPRRYGPGVGSAQGPVPTTRRRATGSGNTTCRHPP